MIQTLDLFKCYIVKIMPCNEGSQMLRISLKTKKSLIAQHGCLQPIVVFEFIHWGWSGTARVGPVTGITLPDRPLRRTAGGKLCQFQSKHTDDI